MIGNLWRAIW